MKPEESQTSLTMALLQLTIVIEAAIFELAMLWLMWQWVALPLGLPAINIFAMILVRTLLSVLRNDVSRAIFDIKKTDKWEKLMKMSLCAKLGEPAVTATITIAVLSVMLFCSYVCHLFAFFG